MKKRKTIMLLVTYRCNLRCVYCYEPKNVHHQMTALQAKRYICEQVEKLDESYEEFEVQFMGGEPLMVFPLIREVSEWLWQQDFKKPLAQIFIPTNGTLLTENIKSWCVQHKDEVCLGLSFDGNRLMQNKNRSNSASQVDLSFFATTWPHQSVKMTLSPETLDYLYDGARFLHDEGFKEIAVDLAMGKDVKWKQEHLKILSIQLRRLSDFYIEHRDLKPISMLGLDVLQPLRQNQRLKKCSCGENLVCIDYDGQEYACHVFSPITASKPQAKESQKIDYSQHERFISEQCKECLLSSVCTICYGMNLICNGDISQQSSFTCQSFKIQYLIACELQMRLAESKDDAITQQQIAYIVKQIKN